MISSNTISENKTTVSRFRKDSVFRNDKSFRFWWFFSTVLYLGIVIYGSLVPLNYQPIPWDIAVLEFQSIPMLDLDIEHRADWVANILLFVPLSFLWCGVLLRSWHGQARAVMTTFFLVAALYGLACSIEFTQQWFPPRTVSQNDIMAETIGAVVGCLLWFICGPAVQSWLVSADRRKNAAYYWERILLVYTIGYCIYSIMPLDLVVSSAEIDLKFQQGKILLWPSFEMPSSISELSSQLSEIFIFFPIGAFFALRERRPGSQPLWLSSFTLVVSLAVILELLQIFVYSRFSSMNDACLRAFGGLLGIWCARSVLDRREREQQWATAIPARKSILGCFGFLFLAAVYYVALCGIFWWPLEWISDPVKLEMRSIRYWQVPFRNYYWGSEFNALTQILQKSLLSLPLGYLMQASVQRCPLRLGSLPQVIVLAAAALAIERGQVYFVGRYPDVTDSLVYFSGGLAGIAVYRLLHQPLPVAPRAAQADIVTLRPWPSDVIRID